MTTYIFEIQNCIQASIEADNRGEARQSLIEDLQSFADEMINDCVVSDGVES